MNESGTEPGDLREDLAQALKGDIEPERLEAYRFATSILPAFSLLSRLFSLNTLDTCLKLMLLHELSRVGGRSTIERIRSLVSFLDPQRVDALVRSLREGGWLDLRASDNSYVLSQTGMNLLMVLYAADVGNVSPENVLARAAQNAEFGAKLDGTQGALSYLLDQLNVLLEEQVDQAKAILTVGRPYRMIQWSRRQHTRQLETIRGVLDTLEEHLDEASRSFARVVRLHETMQELVRIHGSIHTRLRDWNLERLHTSDAGYSIPQLVEAVIGVDDATLISVWDRGVIQLPEQVPDIDTDEIRARFHGARRRVATQEEHYEYQAPAEPSIDAWDSAELDPAAALRSRLTQLLSDATTADPALELEDWIEGEAFTGAAWQISLLSRLEAGSVHLRLDNGREAEIEGVLHARQPSGLPPETLLRWMEERGTLRSIPPGRFSRIRIRLLQGPEQPDCAQSRARMGATDIHEES